MVAMYALVFIVTTPRCGLDAAQAPRDERPPPRADEPVPRAGSREERAEIAALEHDLTAGAPDVRRRAVKRLALIGSREAWQLLFTALADRDSQVGDEAQMRLAGVSDPKVVAELISRAGLDSKDDGARQRVAEAIGRLAVEVDGEMLARRAEDRDLEVAHLLLWSIERLARARHLGGDRERARAAISRLARSHRDGGVRARALLAWSAIGDDELAKRLPELLGDRDAQVRCAVLLAAQERLAEAGLALARTAAADPAVEVRSQAAENLERLRSKPAAIALVEMLEHETRPRPVEKLVAALQRLSGMKYRADPRPWRLWATKLPGDWRPTPSAAPASQEPAPGDRTVAQFAGMPLLSDRLAFLIDFSGSMWTPMPDGRLPKELVDVRVRTALEALPPKTLFNVIPFTNEVLPWRERAVEASPSNVKTAIADFVRCQARGRGNFYDAALCALSDPSVDTLVALTDGVPTGGLHSNMELIVALLLERNRFRKATFDAILVDAPGGMQRRWTDLARATGGRVVAVEQP